MLNELSWNGHWVNERNLAGTQLASGCACMLSCTVMFNSVTLWPVARQAPLSMAFSRQEYWSRLPFPPPGDLSDLGNLHLLVSPALQVASLSTEPPGKPGFKTESGI